MIEYTITYSVAGTTLQAFTVEARDASGNPMYKTRNGPRSELQVHTELVATGYAGSNDIGVKLTAYDALARGLIDRR